MMRAISPRFGAPLTFIALILITAGEAVAQDLPIRSNGPVTLPLPPVRPTPAESVPSVPSVPSVASGDSRDAEDSGDSEDSEDSEDAEDSGDSGARSASTLPPPPRPSPSPPEASDAGDDADAPVPAPRPSEQRALGIPNGPLSARPAEAQAIAGGDGTLLERIAALDPRRNETIRVVGALAVVLGLMLLVRVLLRRAGGALGSGSRPAGVLQVLARYPVARGQSLVLLKLSRRVLLVHQSGATMSTLAEVTDRDEVAALLADLEAGSRSRDAERFRSVLRSFEREHEQARRGPGRVHGAGSAAEIEVVDLTRGQVRGFGSLLPRRRLPA